MRTFDLFRAIEPIVLVFLCAIASCCAGQDVQPKEVRHQPGVEELISGSLIPGHDEDKLLREHALAGELCETIREIPFVAAARVHLTLADRSLLSRDRKAEATAAVLVRTNGPVPSLDRQLTELACAAVEGLEPRNVKVFLTQEKVPVTRTEFIGPIEVVYSSVSTARAIIGGLLGACILLAVGLIFAGIKLRRRRRSRDRDVEAEPGVRE
jgi:type III secretory pathway lipoprotein EscJ